MGKATTYEVAKTQKGWRIFKNGANLSTGDRFKSKGHAEERVAQLLKIEAEIAVNAAELLAYGKQRKAEFLAARAAKKALQPSFAF